MTRKHFNPVAVSVKNALITARRQNAVHTELAIEALASTLSDQFEAVNSRFDRSRFFKACTVKGLV